MFQAVPSNRFDLLNEEIRRTHCARLGLMSLEESAYITHPSIKPLAILEAKSVIRYGISVGHYPDHYSKLLESNDVIALRLATMPEGEVANRRLNESFGIDLALGVGQMIPGVKTFAGIAGVAYYAYQAYDSFNSGSILGGVGNLFLTLLSAAAIEPLGAAAWTGPIVTALGPLTKLGRAFESFLGLIIKGALSPAGKLVQKIPGLGAFMKWVGGKGMGALEAAGGWLGKNATRLAQWLEQQSVKYAGKAAGTPQGMLAKVGKFLSGKVASAAEMISKFIVNMKTFIMSGGQKGFGAAAGAEAKVVGAEAGAATKAVVGAEARTAAEQAASAAAAAESAAIQKMNPLIDRMYADKNVKAYLQKRLGEKFADQRAVEALLMSGDKGLRSSLSKAYSPSVTGQMKAVAAELKAARQLAMETELAAKNLASGAATAAPEAAAVAGAAAPATQTAGAVKNLGSAIAADLRGVNAFLDAQAGKLLSKVEAMQTKQALNSLRGAEPIIFNNKAGQEAARVYMDANGQIFRQMAGKQAVKVSPSEIIRTQRWMKLLTDQGIPAARAQAIARGLTRGLSSGAREVPEAESAAGL